MLCISLFSNTYAVANYLSSMNTVDQDVENAYMLLDLNTEKKTKHLTRIQYHDSERDIPWPYKRHNNLEITGMESKVSRRR